MRLTWGAAGKRLFETGIDRGVLYVDGFGGVAWNGLIAVNENPSGGEPRPYYIDGIKYLNRATRDEYEATITAFYSPPEFDECDGSRSLADGLYAKQQPRKSFGLSYRTLIGNDLDGSDHGYKIHLIYNALAQPAQRPYATTSADPEGLGISWSLTTKPVAVPGAKHTSHFVVDTTEANATTVLNLENILYGNSANAPRLPLPAELMSLFGAGALTVVDPADGSGTFQAMGTSVAMIDAETFQINDAAATISGDEYTVSS